MRIQVYTVISLAGLCLINLAGCSRPADKASGQAAHSHDHDHVHLEAGPHGGNIVEIGAKSHHAEVVHDEASHKIGVYVLDGDAAKVTPVEAKVAQIDVTEGEVSNMYELPAVPQDGEAEGTSSYFEVVSEPLSNVISGKSEAKEARAELRVQIGEKIYVGYVEIAPHAHDEEHNL